MKRLFRLLLAAPLAMVAIVPAGAQTDYRTPAAARAVIQRYYAAIDRGDFRSAFRLWGGDGGASGKSYPRFRTGFATTARSHVDAGAPTNGDAGAGSIYIDVPVDVRAVLKNGTRQHFQGTYTLRRINDVDGATPAQLHWHIASARLKAVR